MIGGGRRTKSPVNQFLRTIKSVIEREEVKFLLAGAWNTVFGYLLTLGLYSLLGGQVHLILLLAVAYVIAITQAFLCLKIFVFRISGGWLSEYFRTYISYGGVAVVSIGLTWLAVEVAGIVFWLVQSVVTVLTIVVSYFLHKYFTFSPRGGRKSDA